MILSSNQICQISGDLKPEVVKKALDFALDMSGQHIPLSEKEKADGCLVTYQITESGMYCVGWGFKNVPEDWKVYDFECDTDIISRIICNTLSKNPLLEHEDLGDGSYHRGFLMENIEGNESCMRMEDVKNPNYGIVAFSPYTTFYGK